MRYGLQLFSFVFLLPVAYGQQLICSLREQWVDSSWQNDYYTTFVYNVQNNEALRTSQNFFPNGWQNNIRIVSAYDDQGRIETATTLSWTGTQWQSALKLVYLYDDVENRLISITTSVWMGSEYHDVSKVTKVYDQTSGLLTGDYMDLRDDQNGNWYHQSCYEYSYNSANQVEHVVFSFWDNLLFWMPQRRSTRIYTSTGNIQMSFEEIMIDNVWQNSAMQHCYYDTGGRLESVLDEEWNNLSEDWINVRKLEFTYDVENRPYQILSKDWSMSDEEWVNHFLTTNAYGTAYLGVEEQQLSVDVFPNPATETLHLNFGQVIAATIQITDLQGKIVQVENVYGTAQEINLSELPSGTYLVNIASEGRFETRSIVKQ